MNDPKYFKVVENIFVFDNDGKVRRDQPELNVMLSPARLDNYLSESLSVAIRELTKGQDRAYFSFSRVLGDTQVRTSVWYGYHDRSGKPL